MAQVAVIGPATIDRVVDDGVEVYKRGGVVMYAGLSFAQLGISTRVLSNVAAADEAMLALLCQRGIEVHTGDSAQTTHFVNYIAGNARRQELLARASPIVAAQLGPVLADVQHVHLGPLYPGDIETAALAVIAADCRVSLDIQGYARQLAEQQIVEQISGDLFPALQRADYIKASAEELKLVLDYYGKTLERLLADCEITECVVTEGSHDGCVVDGAGQRMDFKAAPVAAVMDPTGAGDVFFAAYLTRRLHRGEASGVAARFAADLAARHVEGVFIEAEALLL